MRNDKNAECLRPHLLVFSDAISVIVALVVLLTRQDVRAIVGIDQTNSNCCAQYSLGMTL